MKSVSRKTSELSLSEARASLRQVAEIVAQALGLQTQRSRDNSGFCSLPDGDDSRNGVVCVAGRLHGEETITLKLDVLHMPGDHRAKLGPLFRGLAELGKKAVALEPSTDAEGVTTLSIGMDVKATPLSVTRAASLTSELKRVDEFAKQLQNDLPLMQSTAQWTEAYKQVKEVLAPVPPLPADVAPDARLLEQSEKVLAFLDGGCSIALASESGSAIDFCLSTCAVLLEQLGRTLGNVLLPLLDVAALSKLALQAPGYVALPATALNLAANPYSLSNEIHALLAAQADSGRPVVFHGALSQLQSVFAGGQGHIPDPLMPVVIDVPDIPIESLIGYSLKRSADAQGGLSDAEFSQLQDRVRASIDRLIPECREKYLPVIARREASIWFSKGGTQSQSDTEFPQLLSATARTLSGIPGTSITQRSPAVQQKLTDCLADGSIGEYYKTHLLAQEDAIDELSARLRSEALTRSLEQPVRFCAQGVPGTGKSESVILLARRLGVPYVNIDAASMPDYHTATTQLLGSGRGIVQSHRAGRLEQIAKTESGVVVEISDLDHAHPSVRSAFSDLFLQLLETGQAQSAFGEMFSCTNVIFAFTLNLPAGMDEAVRRSIGFGAAPTETEVSRRVTDEIKSMLSSAFVSRVGSPILFRPLTGAAIVEIARRAIERAVRTAMSRLGADVSAVIVDADAARFVADRQPAGPASSGARQLLEVARQIATDAVIHFTESEDVKNVREILVTVSDRDALRIESK